MESTRFVLALAIMVASLTPVGMASGSDCARPVTLPAVGPACPVDGGYRLDIPGLPPMFTHGPDPHPSSHGNPLVCEETFLFFHGDTVPAPGACAEPVDPHCVGDTDPTQRIEVLYVRPTTTPDNYSAMAPRIRELVREANGILHAESVGLGGNVTLRVACDAGAITVANETVASKSTLVPDLVAKGYDSSYAKYWIWFDQTDQGFAGVATSPAWNDDRLAPDNGNNRTTGYAITYGRDSYVVMLHELSHVMGAVQRSAPHSTGLSHCLDGQDVMCYDDRSTTSQNGKPNLNVVTSPYNPVACPHREVYDCGHDDYFHPSPPAGSYLATHWNLASPLNGFVKVA